MKCGTCEREWQGFAALPRLLGFFVSFDANDRAIPVEQRNCSCEATYSQPTTREAVEAALSDASDKIRLSAEATLADLEGWL